MKISLPKLTILTGQLQVLSVFHNPLRSDKRCRCHEHCMKTKAAACSNSIRAETKPHLLFCDVELQDRRGTFLHGSLNNLIKHNLKKNA